MGRRFVLYTLLKVRIVSFTCLEAIFKTSPCIKSLIKEVKLTMQGIMRCSSLCVHVGNS